VEGVAAVASARLLEGRSAVRSAIRELSGHDLLDSHFDKVWAVMQDGLAQMFYADGMAIVRSTARMLGSETTGENSQGIPIESLADRVVPLFAEPTMGEEVRQAIIDMFREKESPAFEWLTQVCGVYVMMCSLGLEYLSGAQIQQVMLGFRLVLDSDIVISLLCEGERNHPEVEEIFKGWKAIGGTILRATPVLEEVAYHAWVAERAFNEHEHELPTMSKEDAQRLIDNAFVRAFHQLAGVKSTREFWNQYIIEFRGNSDRDYTKIADTLREYATGGLPGATPKHEDFISRATEFLINQVAKISNTDPADLGVVPKNKCERDAILLGQTLSIRDQSGEAGERGTTCIVSSSSLLRHAGSEFSREFGEPDPVVPIRTIAHLLTLVPGVSMGLRSFRMVLFDLTLASRLSPAQGYAYRVVSESGQYDLPWSRRGTMARRLGESMLAEARAQGQPVRAIRQQLREANDPRLSAQLVAEALDGMSVFSKAETENMQLRGEVSRLMQELAEAEARTPKEDPSQASRRERGRSRFPRRDPK